MELALNNVIFCFVPRRGWALSMWLKHRPLKKRDPFAEMLHHLMQPDVPGLQSRVAGLPPTAYDRWSMVQAAHR
jgi:hypothetical protein